MNFSVKEARCLYLGCVGGVGGGGEDYRTFMGYGRLNKLAKRGHFMFRF